MSEISEAPVASEPVAWAPGDEAIVVHNYPSGATLLAGDRVRVVSVPDMTTLVVDLVAGRGDHTDFGWWVHPNDIRRPLESDDATPAADGAARFLLGEESR